MGDFICAVIAIALMGGFLAWASHEDKIHPPVCLKSVKVVSIDALMYRSASITLDDGQHIIVNQATLKPGDNFCTKWKEY